MIQMESPSICFSCKRSSQEVKILDAVKEARPVKICESCTKMEDVIVIRKPTSRQLSDPNKPMSVYNRLRRLAGLDEEDNKQTSFVSQVQRTQAQAQSSSYPHNVPSLSSISSARGAGDLSDYSIKKRREIIEKLGKPVNLVEHANWIVQQERRSRRLTFKQLAQELGESETVLKMFEEGKVPDDGRRIAEKLEQFFHVRLINDDVRMPSYRGSAIPALGSLSSSLGASDIKAMSPAVAIGGWGRKAAADMRAPMTREREVEAPSRLLRFDKESMRNLTLSDLQEMKKRKDEALGIKKEPEDLDGGEWKGEVEFLDSDDEDERKGWD